MIPSVERILVCVYIYMYFICIYMYVFVYARRDNLAIKFSLVNIRITLFQFGILSTYVFEYDHSIDRSIDRSINWSIDGSFDRPFDRFMHSGCTRSDIKLDKILVYISTRGELDYIEKFFFYISQRLKCFQNLSIRYT